MKKLIGIFLAIVVVSQMIVLPASAKVSSKAEHSWRVVTGLGLAEFNDKQKEENVTRAEFAKLIANALGITFDDNSGSDRTKFERAFYGDFAYDGYSLTTSEQNNAYIDVVEGDEGYEAIYALKKLEIMSGDGTGYFYPQNYIKYEEVLKTFVVLASYNVDAKIPGSWANGYVKLASELGIILKGVPMGTEITKYQLCQILYNLFDVEMLKMIAIVDDKAVYEVEEGVTFLNEMIGLYAFSGQLEATSNSTITAPYTTKDNSLQINGIKYTNSTQSPIGSLLGREVEAYRTEDGNVVFMTPIDEEEVTVIDAKDLLGYENGKLEYEVNGRTKSIDIDGLPVIYNGVAVENYSQDIFDIDYGSVTITEDSKKNVVIIWSYGDILVEHTNLNNHSIYDEATAYKLDLSEDNNTVYIFDADGKRKEFEDISAGDILSYIENGTYKEVYIGGEKVSGKINSVNLGENKIEINKKLYEISDELIKNNLLDNISVGFEIVAYKNKFSKIFYIEVKKMTGEATGILIKIVPDDDENVIARFFGEDGKFADYKVAEKVGYTNSHNETSRVQRQSLISLVDGYVGYCKFVINEDGQITKLQIPLESKDYLKQGEEKLYKKEFKLIEYYSSYKLSQNSLGSNVFLNADVELYSVPTDISKRDKYERFTFLDMKEYEFFGGQTISAYFENQSKPVPEAIVVRDKHLSNIPFEFGDSVYVVTKITQGVGEDDELHKEVILTHCTTGEEKTVISKYENGVSGFDNVKTFAQEGDYELEIGDIVTYSQKKDTNELEEIRLIYSCNMQSPAGTEGNRGWLADMGKVATSDYSNKFMIPKEIYDNWKNSPYKHDDLLTYTDTLGLALQLPSKQNPFRVEKGVIQNAPQTSRFGGKLVMLGYAVDFCDGFLKLTTQDLSCENYDPNAILNVGSSYVGVNIEKYFNVVTACSQLGLVEYFDGGVRVASSGYPEDLYTYKKSGKDCSRVLVAATSSGPYHFVIINDYRTK